MDDKLETRRLRYFMQVLESGSVRGAAEVLDMDPSAVSRAVGILETECGTRLLERRGRGVAPTDAGELLAAEIPVPPEVGIAGTIKFKAIWTPANGWQTIGVIIPSAEGGGKPHPTPSKKK